SEPLHTLIPSHGSSGSAVWRRVVDGGTPDRARARGWVSDHAPVGQALQPPASTQPPVMPGAEKAHARNLGPTTKCPGQLVVALAPLGRSIAPWPHAAPVALGQRLRHLGGRRPVL